MQSKTMSTAVGAVLFLGQKAEHLLHSPILFYPGPKKRKQIHRELYNFYGY